LNEAYQQYKNDIKSAEEFSGHQQLKDPLPSKNEVIAYTTLKEPIVAQLSFPSESPRSSESDRAEENNRAEYQELATNSSSANKANQEVVSLLTNLT